jgi:hypothetical protein
MVHKWSIFWRFSCSAYEGSPFGAHLRNESFPRGPPPKRKLPRMAHPTATHNTVPLPDSGSRLNPVTPSTHCCGWHSRVECQPGSERGGLRTQHILGLANHQLQYRMPFLNKGLTTSFFLIFWGFFKWRRYFCHKAGEKLRDSQEV